MPRPPRPPSTLRARIAASLAVLVGSVALAAWLSRAAHDEAHVAIDDVAAAEDGIEHALRLSIALRDAYAHQAHVVIMNHAAHAAHYASAYDAARRALADARRVVPEEHAALARVEDVLRALDANFRDQILPRVPCDPAAGCSGLAAPHDRALALLEDGQRLVDGLAARLDARAADARRRADDANDEAARRIAFVLLGALALAAGVAVWMDRSIGGPLRALEEGTRLVGAGALGTRVAVQSRDELGALAARFNEMAALLEERDARVREAERLAGVGKVAAGVAHEINNPLGVILGYARLIEKQGGQGAADARAIVDEVERCRAIVAGLLDLSRAPKLAPTPVDLQEVAKDVAARLAAGGAGADVRVRARGDVVVQADEGKVRQVLTNLFTNARDAAPDAPVDVVVEGRAADVVVSVRDRGPGVDAATRARLFEPFFTTKAHGTGLGLAVSSALARAHGGDVALVDDGPGARFDLVLPRAGPRGAA